MKVTVKLYAGLRDYLPESGSQGIDFEIDGPMTPNQLLNRLHVPESKVHLVLLNGTFVEPSQRNQPILKDNDTLAAWPAVAGG